MLLFKQNLKTQYKFTGHLESTWLHIVAKSVDVECRGCAFDLKPVSSGIVHFLCTLSFENNK